MVSIYELAMAGLASICQFAMKIWYKYDLSIQNKQINPSVIKILFRPLKPIENQLILRMKAGVHRFKHSIFNFIYGSLKHENQTGFQHLFSAILRM